MAGQIADQACRLFTRTFGEALVYGKSLAAAMEAGRRAAFTLGDWPKRSVDWALPAMYCSSHVGPGFAITAVARSPDEQWLQDALGTLGIARDREPVLAARFELLDLNYERLLQGEPGILTVLGSKGSGKSRLLRELTAQAIAQGHLPLLVSTDDETVDYSKFKDVGAIRETWVRALQRTCKALRLPFPNPCQLNLVKDGLSGSSSEKLHASVAEALAVAPQTLQPLLRALQRDLLGVLAQARKDFPQRHLPGARVWILLDHLHYYPPELQPGFFDPFVTPFTRFGLSETASEPLPVVLAFDPAANAAQVLKPVAEGKCRGWMADLTLDPFSADGVDVLTYSRILLHPHNPALYKSYTGEPISGLPWMINPLAEDKLRDEWLGKLRHWLKRQPCDFIEQDLYKWVEAAQEKNFLGKADDEEKLKQLQL
jgi:hypothetical protein